MRTGRPDTWLILNVAIPVDIYAPGCAIRPETIIDAVVEGLDMLEKKRLKLSSHTLEKPELPVQPSAADKRIKGKSVAEEWKEEIAAAAKANAEDAALDATQEEQ